MTWAINFLRFLSIIFSRLLDFMIEIAGCFDCTATSDFHNFYHGGSFIKFSLIWQCNFLNGKTIKNRERFGGRPNFSKSRWEIGLSKINAKKYTVMLLFRHTVCKKYKIGKLCLLNICLSLWAFRKREELTRKIARPIKTLKIIFIERNTLISVFEN